MSDYENTATLSNVVMTLAGGCQMTLNGDGPFGPGEWLSADMKVAPDKYRR